MRMKNFLEMLLKKKSNQIHVWCLEKLLSHNDPQNVERVKDAVYSNCVFKTNIKLVLTQVDANVKKARKWCWVY